jgi:hypothetical protein
MYTDINFKTKKALKDAVAAGRAVGVFQPGPFGGPPPQTGKGLAVEGPHYPAAHSWYAQVDVENGRVVRVK